MKKKILPKNREAGQLMDSFVRKGGRKCMALHAVNAASGIHRWTQKSSPVVFVFAGLVKSTQRRSRRVHGTAGAGRFVTPSGGAGSACFTWKIRIICHPRDEGLHFDE